MDDEIDAAARRFVEDVASQSSDTKTAVRFVNCTNSEVELFWINFSGEYIRYQILPKDGFVDINTYTKHTWIALDCRTKDRMKIDNNWTYSAQTVEQKFQSRYPGRAMPENYRFMRMRVAISVALCSLGYLSLLAARNSLKVEGQADELDLPKVLIKNLKKAIAQREYLIEKFGEAE